MGRQSRRRRLRGQLTVRLPVSLTLKEEHRLELGRLIGARDRQVNDAGREYLTLPAPFEDVVLVDGDTLTPATCARLVEALDYFERQRNPLRPRELTRQAGAKEVLRTVGRLTPPRSKE